MDEPRADRDRLRDLVAGFRAHLEARGRSGLLGVPAGRSPHVQPRRDVTGRPGAPQAAGAVPPAAPASAVSGPVAHEAPASTGDGGWRLALVREELGDCQRCKLAPGRQHIVFGTGNPDATLMFVGEAPGADEDRQGEPFVGAAGQLLTRMIQAMGFSRGDVYIANVLKCRPPQNRNPEPDEVAACEPFLRKQIEAVRPRMIVTLGKFAAQALLRETTPITRLRGNPREYQGIPVMPTYHPAFLLRDASRKKEAWEDLKAVVAALERMGVPPPRPLAHGRE